MIDFFGRPGEGASERRSLPRVAPVSKVWAAVDNETRDELLEIGRAHV